MMGLLISAFHGVCHRPEEEVGLWERMEHILSGGSTCLLRTLLISLLVSKSNRGVTGWQCQDRHSVTGAGSRPYCLLLMSMSLMEIGECEGHISIQIASILAAIQLPCCSSTHPHTH